MTIIDCKLRLIASPRSWIEGEAVRQFYATARLPGVRLAVGFPDLHPGRGTPVGAAFVSENIIYPHVIGSDIGCGMALFKTDLPVRSAARVKKWADLRFNLEQPCDEIVGGFLAARGLESTRFDEQLGTVGGGNHFAELQKVEKVLDTGAFRESGLDENQLAVLVHSGSRGLGEAVLRDYVRKHHGQGVAPASSAAAEYLREHDRAVRWARTNRALVAKRFVSTVGAEAECVWDGCHNSIAPVRPEGPETEGETSSSRWIHRKGAVAAEGGPLVIPGSRGSLSYLVKLTGDGQSHGWSLAHGAGRKWSRSAARLRMRERFRVQELVQTPLGGRVICEQRDLLYEEAPAAYKNIETVIGDLADAGLISVIATLRPLLTYKTRVVRR